MKQKKETKLSLKKETIQDLDFVLDKNEQKMIEGGSAYALKGTTQVPIFCL